MNEKITISLVNWNNRSEVLTYIRHEVFVKEQNVPLELEIDGLDTECYHVLAFDENNNPVGTARMMKDGHIGRVAVLKKQRGLGIGLMMMNKLMEEAGSLGIKEVCLDAQVNVIEFYKRQGFSEIGEVFMDAGIEHKRMVKIL